MRMTLESLSLDGHLPLASDECPRIIEQSLQGQPLICLKYGSLLGCTFDKGHYY